MKVLINYRGKKISVDVEKTGLFSEGAGLTFRTKETVSLLFEFKEDVYYRGALTSLFVFFPFLAIWLDKNNRVLETKIIKPFKLKILPSKSFRKIVEIPINVKNKKIIDFFVGKSRKI